MDPQERALVLDQLAASHLRIMALASGLTLPQWSFREAPDRWSIAENIEHLILFERFILSAITTHLDGAAEPEKKELVAPKQSLVLGLAGARHIKFNARDAVRPAGRWSGPAELLNELRLVRDNTTAFAMETEADLRNHFFAHIAWGDLDCFQWLLLLSQHTLRHALQIEQVMADPLYPASGRR